jgi:4-hydroxy-L-threonine phosphate dehydrogenase PdxA
MSDKIKLGISIGDVNGIGLEVILKTFNLKAHIFAFYESDYNRFHSLLFIIVYTYAFYD